MHANLEINELAFYSEPLTAGTHRSVGPACQRYENRGTVLLDVDRPEFADDELFWRRHRHYEHPQGIAHTLSYLVGPIAGAKDYGGDHGGMAVQFDGEAPEPVKAARSRVTPRLYILRRL